ncbi:MAG TPA: TlpA disulfide reductase family protein [Gemmatimonadaceae bacterium]|nr:TlpA disulfide reductase family protein [Gemmatimonadaceae bacterium]
MTSRQQWLIVLGIVAFVLGSVAVGAFAMREELFPVEVGSRAPHFEARALGAGRDRVRSLDDYRGRVLVLNVWATWCPPCVYEMPSFERLREQVADSNLRIVAVSVDEFVPGDSVLAFARGLGVTFEILHDSSRAIDRAYQITGYPETFVIARDGTIRKKWIGPADWASPANVALIRGLLGQ